MDLKSGATLWSSDAPKLRSLSILRKKSSCDVVIVGAGISGVLVAHEMVKRGFKVVLVDKRPPVTASTSASTALLLQQTDQSLADLSKLHGKRRARRVYRLGGIAIREIEKIVRRLKIDCGFKRKSCLYLASDAKGLRAIHTEKAALRRAGFPVRFLSAAKLRTGHGLKFPGALFFPGAAEMDPVKFTRALLSHLLRAGKCRIVRANMKRVVQSGEEVVLQTTGTTSIRASHAVLAPGYEAVPFLELKRVRLHSSYVAASEPLPPGELWPGECLIWETARPYFYLRTSQDHRVVIGGEDEPFADPAKRDARIRAKGTRLRRRFAQLFPSVPFVPACTWAGTFAETTDGLPFIGSFGNSPRVFYALGYGGNGITFSQIAARIVADACAGRKNRDRFLFRLDR